MTLQLNSTFELNNGGRMPAFGLGTYKMTDEYKARRAFEHAIDLGYRHFDTASLYDNEKLLGEAIRASGLPRGEFFITSKLWNDDQGYENAKNAFAKSNELLGLDYIDLYLIHWPVPRYRLDSWKAMEELHEAGVARAIGVSNYMVLHLDELLGRCNVRPAVNQIELHPWNYGARKPVVDLCEKNSIIVTAYCSLTRGIKLNDLALEVLAKKYKKSPAQILIRWGLQKGICEIPKSANPKRIEENAEIFDFTIEDVDIGIIDSWNENLCVSWNPEKAL